MQSNISTEVAKTHCPYCGAPIRLVIDPQEDTESYVEDCEVCCQPMIVEVSDGELLSLKRESD